MKLHRGRLIDHIHLRAKGFAATAAFYRAVLGALGAVGGHRYRRGMKPAVPASSGQLHRECRIIGGRATGNRLLLSDGQRPNGQGERTADD